MGNLKKKEEKERNIFLSALTIPIYIFLSKICKLLSVKVTDNQFLSLSWPKIFFVDLYLHKWLHFIGNNWPKQWPSVLNPLTLGATRILQVLPFLHSFLTGNHKCVMHPKMKNLTKGQLYNFLKELQSIIELK